MEPGIQDPGEPPMALAAIVQKLADRSLLVVDDDRALCDRLVLALSRRGFEAQGARSILEARAAIDQRMPAFAVVDLRLLDGSGLDFVHELHARRPETRALILTGYGNIATAVAAVKAGAIDYLPKPAEPDEIVRALVIGPLEIPPPPEKPMSADRVWWEHIQRVHAQCDRNVSETARRLGMHRRTLQRILAKRAPK